MKETFIKRIITEGVVDTRKYHYIYECNFTALQSNALMPSLLARPPTWKKTTGLS